MRARRRSDGLHDPRTHARGDGSELRSRTSPRCRGSGRRAARFLSELVGGQSTQGLAGRPGGGHGRAGRSHLATGRLARRTLCRKGGGRRIPGADGALPHLRRKREAGRCGRHRVRNPRDRLRIAARRTRRPVSEERPESTRISAGGATGPKLHVYAGVAATGIFADGTYCQNAGNGFATDCPDGATGDVRGGSHRGVPCGVRRGERGLCAPSRQRFSRRARRNVCRSRVHAHVSVRKTNGRQAVRNHRDRPHRRSRRHFSKRWFRPGVSYCRTMMSFVP